MQRLTYRRVKPRGLGWWQQPEILGCVWVHKSKCQQLDKPISLFPYFLSELNPVCVYE